MKRRSGQTRAYSATEDYGNTSMKLEDGTDELLNEIVDILETADCEVPANILLLGRSGSGKSSLINTLHKAITGRYYKIAVQGSGNGQSVTLDLMRYENCGVTVDRISDESRKTRMKKVVPRLPHIWDCAGLGDENTPKLREILELLIGGYIRPGTSIEALESMQRTYGIGRLKRVLESPNPSWKVSKIAFLAACSEPIPKNLIDCLKDILRIYDSRTLIRKYQCEVNVVITKYDLVKDSDEVNLDGMGTENVIKYEDFQGVEDRMAREFSFGGALTSHTLRWVSLTDSVGYDNPKVDKIALEFLKRMIEPGVPRAEENAPIIRDDNMRHVYRFLTLMEDAFFKLWEYIQANLEYPYVITVIAVVFVLWFFYKLLTVAF